MTKDGNLNRIVCNLGKLGNNSCSSTGEWTHCRYVFLGFLNKQESESKVYFVGECIPKEKECRKGVRQGKSQTRVPRRGHSYHGNSGQFWGEKEGRGMIS